MQAIPAHLLIPHTYILKTNLIEPRPPQSTWTATPTVFPGNSEVVDPTGEEKRQKPKEFGTLVSWVALGFISVDRNAIFGCKINMCLSFARDDALGVGRQVRCCRNINHKNN